MKTLLRNFFLIALLSGISFFSNAQGFTPGPGFKQLNFGLGVSEYGVPVYASFDFGVADRITVAPLVNFRLDNYYNFFNLGARGDYHWGSHIDDLPQELDLYGGLALGYSIWSYDVPFGNENISDGDVFLGLKAGARWYFNENWGANAELSHGSNRAIRGLTIGMSYMF